MDIIPSRNNIQVFKSQIFTLKYQARPYYLWSGKLRHYSQPKGASSVLLILILGGLKTGLRQVHSRSLEGFVC